eukprot:TRINITY_DN8358_c0_g1_i1.p1 TRINITY_DN8358_c0_g1~~TRINITY_DN8358_c0_g1_i1.p1  ORF type:complete len:472 (+),score=137.00 TRINITY_DN8358_c0_g1_i1:217-1632(+)
MATAVTISPAQQQSAQQPQNNSPGREDLLSDAPYKCIACRMVFDSSESQRNHYKLEFHRFNLKRKVAGLPPIQQDVFDKKITEIRSKQVEAEKPVAYSCKTCNKQYTNENTLKQHLQSKKHLEQAGQGTSAKAAKKSQNSRRVVNASKLAEEQQKKKNKEQESEELKKAEEVQPQQSQNEKKEELVVEAPAKSEEANSESKPIDGESQTKPEGEEEETPKTPEQIIEEKIKLGLALRLSPDFDCLFCREKAPGLKKNLKHMTMEHGMFIPDIEYVTDIKGLVSYLGEKVGIGNTCLYCNKTFNSVEAVRGHMASLNHCKLLYDERGAAEISDYYNFTSSYGDIQIDLTKSEGETDEEAEARAIDMLTRKSAAKLSEDGLELVLPDGRTIGHRSLQAYYKQRVRTPEVRESALIVNAMMNHYRALGWTTQASQRPSGMDPEVIKYQQRQQGEQMRLGIKTNKIYIKRPQMGF